MIGQLFHIRVRNPGINNFRGLGFQLVSKKLQLHCIAGGRGNSSGFFFRSKIFACPGNLGRFEQFSLSCGFNNFCIGIGQYRCSRIKSFCAFCGSRAIQGYVACLIIALFCQSSVSIRGISLVILAPARIFNMQGGKINPVCFQIISQCFWRKSSCRGRIPCAERPCVRNHHHYPAAVILPGKIVHGFLDTGKGIFIYVMG